MAKQLAGIASPELQKLIGDKGIISSQLDSANGGMNRSSMDEASYQGALGQLNSGYAQAGRNNEQAISYNALRSGEGRLSSSVPQSAIQSSAVSLERDRQTALNNLKFQSASSSMGDYNQLLGLMGQGANTSMGLAQGFSGAQGAAIGGLSNQSQMGGALGGAAAGAGVGATFGPWGAVIGGGLGAVGGLLSTPS